MIIIGILYYTCMNMYLHLRNACTNIGLMKYNKKDCYEKRATY